MRLIISLLLCLTCSQATSQFLEKTFVRTDKDLYEPGDTLWFKGYVFDMYNMIADSSLNLHVFLHNQYGSKVVDSSWPIRAGMVDGFMVMPSDEGRYYLSALTMNMMNLPPEARYSKELFIRSGLVDAVKILAKPDKEIYIPGEQMIVDINASLNSKEKAVNQRFIYELWAGKERILRKKFKTDQQGKFRLKIFKVPSTPEALTLLITTAGADIGRASTLSLPLKVKHPSIDLQFMPEGGHLVKGINSKVAFKAISSDGKPVDINGVLLNAHGKVMDSISSLYQGMGQFYLRPNNERYTFKITGPTGLDSLYQLPEILPEGHLLSIVNDEAGDLIKLSKGTQQHNTQLRVVIKQHDKEVSRITPKGKSVEFFRLPANRLDVGLVKVSLEDVNGLIHSERLYFSNRLKPLNVDIALDKESYLPRDKVTASIRVTTAAGEPVIGNFSFAAVDDTQNASPKPNQAHLMAQILLQSELRGTIPTPNFYFTKDPLAKKALDLVVLTHGWRDYKLDDFVDYEVISGLLRHTERQKKILANRDISIFNTTTFSESLVTTNAKGRFRIPAHHFKYKGDSFIVVAKAEGKKEKPNLLIDIDNRQALSRFKKEIGTTIEQQETSDFSIYQAHNKLTFDRFGSTLLLNSVEVFGKASKDSCGLKEEMYKYPWTIKTRGELDLDDPDVIKILKQVSYKVAGFGDVKIYRRKGTFVAGTDYLLSYEHYRKSYEINGQRKISSYPLTYLVSINCESTFVFGPNKNMSQTVGTLDLSNVESIALVDPLYTDGSFGDRYVGLIEIHTINDVVVRRPYLQKFFTYTTNPSQEARFYSPSYKTEKAKALPIPDLRTTLCWQATFITDENGEATISYYNADRDNRIRITVEGLGNKQRFGFAQKDYRVLMPVTDSGN